MGSGSVSIIIPSYDGNVDNVLENLKEQSLHGWDYVASTRTSPAARARNLGAQKAAGEFLIFIDDDVKFNSQFALEQVINTLKDLGPKDAVNLTWYVTSKLNWIGRAWTQDALFTFDHSAQRTEISWRECGAACFAIRSDWFKTLNGYDETLISGEDCDLAYRIIKAGGTIYTLPAFQVNHQPPVTLCEAIKKIYWYERGNAQVARKNPEADYRINLDRWWKAVSYFLIRTFALFPLMFFKVNYRQRWPKLAFRPIQTLFSYFGAWAYVWEWLFPSNQQHAGCNQLTDIVESKVKNG